jgi:outer membrane receptor for ferric coprogen and ferric-rhodotorulic acid
VSSSNILAEVNTLFKMIQWGAYGAFRFHPTKNLALVVGGRLSDYRSNQLIDISIFGQPFPPSINNYKDSNKFTPYAGITYNLGSHYTLYASYADIYFTSGGQQTKDHGQLTPADGVNMEAGIKGSWFRNTLNASLALFKVDQSGIGTLDPTVPPSYSCCFIPMSVKSKGFEAEVTGLITPNWQLTAGYTYDIHQDTSAYFVSELPRNLFKLWTNYQFPAVGRRWSIGGGLQAQSANRVAECVAYASAQFVRFHQGAYVVAALRAAYTFNQHWSASLNLNNIFDRTYYQTLGQLELGNWYGAPRNFMFKIEGKL